DALARCTAVLTTPSTLALEARLAGRTTALIDPHAALAWVRADAIWQPDTDRARSDTAELRAAEATIDRDEPMRTFRGVGDLWRLMRTLIDTPGDLRRGAPTHHNAATNVANQIADLAESAAPADRPPAVYSASCAPIPPADRPRVVNVYITDGEPLGGVPVWCDRMARAFAEDTSLGYDVRTLVVSTQRWWQDAESVPPIEPGGPNVSVCLIDPHDSPALAVETVTESLRALEPSIVIPHYGDVCHAAAAALRPDGVRTVAMMQTDDWIYRTTLETYTGWSAAVGGSAACAAWLNDHAGDRPVRTIRNGNPITTEPRTPSDSGPLRLAYVGRMVELQKRLSDLHTLADELDARGISAELHLVGDGPDLDAFLARERVRTREHVRLFVHGKRSPAWVTEFWPTMDLCVLVSENEGTAMVTLEAMSAGVVPVVTRTGSGAEDWIADGINGVQVDIGDMARMAERIAELHRARRTDMARAAWTTAAEHASLADAAREWADLLDAAVRQPLDPATNDHACRLIEAHRWKDAHSTDPGRDIAWATERLQQAGYRSISTDAPGAHSDAVVVTSPATPELLDLMNTWRSNGLGVALAPNLINPEWVRLAAAFSRAHRSGARSIVVYGCGDHTRRAARAFDWARENGITIAGLIDDAPRTDTMLGLPVTNTGDAIERFGIDAIVLSSDAWEGSLWQNAARFRNAGLPVHSLYGQYEMPKTPKPASIPRVA
ncbi:MAG: glycosyltransferase family 4 protein, partial [Planctomycetota bacterium]